MPKFTIKGYSDDLIEIEGELEEELNYYPSDDGSAYLACYDGTLLHVQYDDDGIWRFKLLARGHAFEAIAPNNPSDPDAYSDVVYFDDIGLITTGWFVLGDQKVVAIY